MSRATSSTLDDADASALAAFDLCLTSLQVAAETRDVAFMIPPTPLGSPIHTTTRFAKRSRLPSVDDEQEVDAAEGDAAGSALVLLSSRLEDELGLLQKREWKRTKKSHQQLGFYAITSAFHRALAERNAAQPCSTAE
ncbi:hypothetical protein DYB37_001957 [Aphanomyces astaci]|uniref:Uncharacterized protein n=1 Tax=Aphanomyces astaci TaxID=112090 RepID=A0A3R6Y2W1_APHAT|nr:hypothetical protein DYB35_001376 [Aphanomyces astaci]RHZ19479.1 hypothetical protein DYB37_001957 [Aphanomyces astaci]